MRVIGRWVRRHCTQLGYARTRVGCVGVVSDREAIATDPIVRREVIERDKGACVDCKHAADHIHHVIPRSMLPGRLIEKRDHPRNLACLCWRCHSKAATKEARARHLRYLRERWGYEYSDMPWRGVLDEG